MNRFCHIYLHTHAHSLTHAHTHRVQPNSCAVDAKYAKFVPRCYGTYEADHEEMASFGPKGDRNKYKWSTESETKEIWWWGRIDMYPPSG
jgi:hypothetical protein